MQSKIICGLTRLLENKGSHFRIGRIVLGLAVVLVGTLLHAQALNGQAAAKGIKTGQSRTVMPDGQLLLLGGSDASAPVSDGYLVDRSGHVASLPSGLNIARAGHTATLLPNGTVLIFGGMDAKGHIVESSELFDPTTQTFLLLTDVLAVPRAYHTATVLTDGTVLFVGGVMAGGEFPDDVQIWDFQSRHALSYQAFLQTPRQGHSAALLSDGTVRISSGTDRFGRPIPTDEVYDPISRHFSIVTQAVEWDNATPFRTVASIPDDGATNASIQPTLSIRFSRLIDVTTANSGTFVLVGPDQKPVATSVTPLENGRLVFVVPQDVLLTGSEYVLRISHVLDGNGEPLPDTSISFQTAGEPSEFGADGQGPSTTTTQWQQLRPLQAPPNVTALAGQVLKLTGWPLQHVTLEMDGKKTHTDSTGRFLLTGLTPGRHVLWIDATTANRPDVSYGLYEVGVTIQANKTTALNYTIWMTPLDTAHTITIPSPTTTETVITNPRLPGLELHIPANTVITDRSGKVVRQINITPIPLDKPPFPLPVGIQVPIYFTIQPGGAYIKVWNPSSGPAGARLIYPNAFNLRPGTIFDFWNYDADVRGWYMYGHGKVNADGSHIVPDPGVVIYELTGAMASSSGGGLQGCLAGNKKVACPRGADPVSLATGQFVYEKTDLFLPDTIPLRFSRTYISGDSLTRSFGVGFTDVYDMFLIGDMNPYTFQDLILTDGNRIHFDRISKGTSYLDAVYVHATSPGSPFYGARLTWVPVVLGGINPGVPSHWKMTLKDGTTLLFPEASTSTNPWCQAVTQIIDRYSNIVNLTRTPTSNSPTGCNLTQVTSPNGRYITFTHDSQGRFKQAQDNIGRTVKYTYDAAGRLSTVTDVNNGVTTYTYNDQNQMTTIQDARGIVYLTNQYDPVSGRVAQQTLADNSTYLFSYIPTNNTAQTHFSASVGGNGGGGGSITETACWGPNGWSRSDSTCNAGYLPLVSQTDVTDPRGYIRELKFGPSGYVTSDSHAVGQPEQQTTTYNYYSDNLLQSVTDPLGRVTSFNYDANGNTASVTFLSGSSNSVSTTFTYEPAFNKLASVTDTLGHSNTFSYDTLGNLIAANDSLNHQSSFAYNGFGQLVSSTDAMNNTTQFSYAGGDLMSVTDPMGNQSTSVFDAAGRIISETEPLGATRAIQYNALNLVAQITDPAGGNTTFSYDPNGNVLSLTDANQHSTILTYDNMDRVQTRSDPLHRVETYAYDANGNLASSTDRKGQVTSVTYDALNRVKLVGYNTQVNGGNSTYESTVSYTYDAGNRVTQALDSAGSTITNVYDDLDHLTSQTTALGSISYTYDKAGRRATMQLAGQPQVAYTYDNANRLTGITESTSTVSFGYDNLNRRTSLTLPNGVTVVYGYDNDSRISALTYNFGANMLGNLTYTYDPAGRRIQVGGSFARTSLPGAIGAAAYDEANELTNWNGIPVSYDLNGNMQSDGTNLFTWNARNQVAKVNNVSLQYDAYGRRMQNVAGTSFLYDGGNAVQELSGTTTTANLLDGGVDELFTRTDPSGSFTPLQDALGTTIALIDANGNIQTTYSYDPFGNTTVSGAASSNPAQYTGRENENNGLYYYRARYYSPILHRFINEDPLGFAGSGANLYMYAEDNPVNFSDSFGLSSTEADAALADIHAILGPLDRFYATQNLSGRKEGNDLGIRSAEQSFGQCLSEHAKDYSLVGAYDLVAGTDYRESFGGSFFGGNHVMSLMQFVSGDTGEGPVLIPAGIQELAPEGMGMFANLMYQASFNYTLYAIPAINKGAGMSFMTQQAEQSAQIGSIMGSASTALETFNLVRLGVDIGFTLAEFAGCSMQR